MRKRVVGVILAASTAGSLAVLAVPHSGPASVAKVPTCIEKTVGQAHIQVGYCP